MSRRLRVPVLDLALAVLALALALAELLVWDEWSVGEPRPLQVAGAAVVCSSLALRRCLPLAAVAVGATGALLLTVGGDPPQLLAAGLVGMLLSYSIAAALDGRALLVAVVMLAAAVLIRDVVDPALNGFDIVIDALFFAAPFVVGRVVRRRERRIEHVAQAADDRTRDAIRGERERIARELHDVIAHGMSVMVIQADAARHGLAPGDEETGAALAEIERTGRESLREMRRLLDLLRADGAPDDETVLTPQPGLGGVEALARSVGQAGLPVEVRVEGKPRPLAPGVDLAAYRIVQEALTNVLRHAGPARAKVVIGYTDRDVNLRIEDDGRGNGNGSAGGGKGLVGMRERARLYGGTLEAGRRPTGFIVTASLPLQTP